MQNRMSSRYTLKEEKEVRLVEERGREEEKEEERKRGEGGDKEPEHVRMLFSEWEMGEDSQQSCTNIDILVNS